VGSQKEPIFFYKKYRKLFGGLNYFSYLCIVINQLKKKP